MEDYNNIIEGILYLKGDEGIDIKEVLMAYKLLILVVNINLQRILSIFLIIKKW